MSMQAMARWLSGEKKAVMVTLVAAFLGSLLLAALVAPGSEAQSSLPANCQPSGSAVTCTFDTPGASTWTVPAGVTQATFDVFGAQGGAEGTGRALGGLGGEANATISVTPGDTLQVNVGGKGGNGLLPRSAGGAGGFNGGATGGAAGAEFPEFPCCTSAGGGGGASDVRSGDFELADRIIVAGGGGGAGGADGRGEPNQPSGAYNGGVGGGLSGSAGEGNSSDCFNRCGTGGTGGTSSGGGSGGFFPRFFPEEGTGDDGDLGTGGDGGFSLEFNSDGGGGGGGGYYGGGGGGAGFYGGGGGGGSGFGPSGVVFHSGVRSGNGLVTIIYTPPDTTAPSVTQTSPLDQGRLNKTDNVTAEFSEPVQNVSTETFILERKISVRKAPPKFEPVLASVSPASGEVGVGGLATLNPAQDLPKGEYRATITTEVTDLANPANALDQESGRAGNQPKVWTFTVPK